MNLPDNTKGMPCMVRIQLVSEYFTMMRIEQGKDYLIEMIPDMSDKSEMAIAALENGDAVPELLEKACNVLFPLIEQAEKQMREIMHTFVIKELRSNNLVCHDQLLLASGESIDIPQSLSEKEYGIYINYPFCDEVPHAFFYHLHEIIFHTIDSYDQEVLKDLWLHDRLHMNAPEHQMIPQMVEQMHEELVSLFGVTSPEGTKPFLRFPRALNLCHD